jgi:hypothetical protein
MVVSSANRRAVRAGVTQGSLVVLLALSLVETGCAEGARLVQVNNEGGVVTYPLKKDRESIYASPFRTDALNMIEQRCGKSYTIVLEGETRGQSRRSGEEGEDEVSTQRFWGLQFRCK